MDTTLTSSTYQEQFNQFTPSVFKNELFGNLNVLKDTSGKLWFIGVEVARMLGYQKPRNAIYSIISKNNKLVANHSRFVPDLGTNSVTRGNPNITLISEQGLIELINRSELNNEVIRQFKDFVNNVMVSMRKHGIAISDEFRFQVNNMSDNELRERLINAQSAVDYYNRMMEDKENTVSLSAIASELGITPQELNNFLSLHGFHKRLGKTNMYVPKVEFIDDGLVLVRKTDTTDEHGYPQVTQYTVGYTEKGRDIIVSMYRKEAFSKVNDSQMRPINDMLTKQPTVVNNYYNYNYNIYQMDPQLMQMLINSIPDPIQRHNAQTRFNNLNTQQPDRKPVIEFTNPKYNEWKY